MICNSNIVRHDSIVTNILVLNKRQNISDHGVNYILSLGFFWIILQHIDTVGRGLDMLQKSDKDPCAICHLSGVSAKSSFCVADDDDDYPVTSH